MKKGFTLIELLGVIVILSVIALITTPVIQSAISNNKNATCESQTKSYEKAAKNYVTNNIYEYDCNPGENEAEFEVNLSDLTLLSPLISFPISSIASWVILFSKKTVTPTFCSSFFSIKFTFMMIAKMTLIKKIQAATVPIDAIE